MLQYFDGIAGLWRVRSQLKTQSGRPRTMKTNENIAQMAAILKDNHHASCRMIAESMGVPKTIVHRILSDDLKK